MKRDFGNYLLHLFEIHLDRCLVIHLNDIHRYLECIQEYGNRTKSEIRNAIVQLYYDNRIKDIGVVSNDVYIIYK